jgi:hypothetical protein
VARDSCVPSLLSSVRAQAPGAPWPHGGRCPTLAARPILGNHPMNSDESWRRLDLVPSFFGGQSSGPFGSPTSSWHLMDVVKATSPSRPAETPATAWLARDGATLGVCTSLQDDDLLAKRSKVFSITRLVRPRKRRASIQERPRRSRETCPRSIARLTLQASFHGQHGTFG